MQEKLRYCLYARKSSEADERQALSIDSQIKEMTELANKEGLEIVETIQESKSAKESKLRKGYNKLLGGITENRFDAILTWAPDRLSRNAGDLGTLVDLMDRGILKRIQTSGQSFTNTPDEKFLLMILCSQAKLENDNRSKNVKRGMRAKCATGTRPGPTPLGYRLVRDQNSSKPSTIAIDEERAPFIQKAFNYIAEDGLSGRQVQEYLEDEGFRSTRGKKVGFSMIYRMLRDPFYCGEFIYGGVKYKGSYEPLISKKLFEKAQNSLRVVEKGKWGRKDFYFNRIFKCGSCGSGISGTEHINRHGKKYTYYKCNKYGGRKKCTGKYIREERLIEEVAQIVDRLKEQSLHNKRKILHEVDKINSLEKMKYGDKAKLTTSQEYVGFILKNGNTREKADVLRCIDGQLYLREGRVEM